MDGRPINGDRMSDRTVSAVVVRFDVFQVDLRAGELRKEGGRIKLQEQPFRVLSLLLSQPGELVTRDEIRQNLWPADTFVDFDHGLNSAVARLREALRDSADKPRFIETVAKRGYRFIGVLEDLAPVPRIPDESQSLMKSEVAPPAGRHELPKSRRDAGATKRPVRTWIAGVPLVVLLGAVGLLPFFGKTAETRLPSIEVMPLVGLRGFQVTPAFSPDGNQVAFRNSDGAHHTGIYTALVGGEKSLRLTSDSGDCCPTWSPDGRQVAFTRYADKTISIILISALGGTEHRVYRGPAPMGGGLAWSPNGKFLAFPEASGVDSPRSWISLLSLADYSTRRLTLPPGGSLDQSPKFSPDGSQIAFVRSTVAGVSNDVYVIAAAGGEARRLTFDHRPIVGPPAWTVDGREIVFSSTRGGPESLWRVFARGGDPRPVAGPMGEGGWPSIPPKGDQLVYHQVVAKFNIWRLDLKDPKHHQRPPFAVVSEKGDKMRPELSPDGKKIAFESNRLGFWDIWTCATDGSNCDQLTSLHGTAGRARWSPNGRYVAFEFHPKEQSEIYVVEVPGGVPRLLPTIPGADNLSPSWSRDGQWIYFASKRGSEPFQIWKMAVSGGAPIKLTKNGGISGVESFDGRFLYYSKYEAGGIWRMPLGGGEETQVLEEVRGGGWPNWALTSDGIYFLRFDKSPHATIQFLDFATHKIIPIWTLEKEPGWGLAMSRDGKSIVYVQDEFAESNIMLVKNFR
jgi:Tol biopolymer transport system component/DNA-binding winged helix-turn-helix (wHTH) protein